VTITKRQALGTLTKTRLLDVADEIGLTGLSRKKKDEVVEALASSRAAKLSDLLALYSRNELKSACEAAGLSTKGREKAVIVDRLLGNGHADSEAEPAPEKTKAKAVTKAMSKRSIRHYDHPDKKRPNNPPVGLVTPDTDPPVPTKKTYAYDPHVDPALQFSNAGAKVDRILDEGLAAENLDVAKRALQELRRHREPYLAWAGKAERTSFELDTVSLHVHERIDPKTLIDFVRAHNGDLHTEQLGLFDQPHENLPLREAVDFYRHEHNWSNRLIAGDSLLVMNSLLEKEGLGGKVQMVYLDPPYGISYGSNFQPFVGRREVKDRKDADLTREPEVLRAFRDTWELNIHSYLAALRDRLLLARDLLAATGSCFVQISSENVHRVTLLLDEIFGRENFVELIAFRKKTMPLGGRLLEGVCDYIVWYAKDKEQVKYRGLFTPSTVEGDSHWNIALEPGRPPRKMTRSEIDDHSQLPPNTDVAQLISLYPTGSFSTGIYSFEYEGKTYSPPPNRSWKTPIEGMRRLALAKRLVPYKGGDTLRYLLKASDYPVSPLSNVWADTSAASDMDFVVQTSTKVLARCLLMSTDPGDLVLDPTCGSGTTAVVAEKYGRRWITTDTSRVAITIARQRLMTSVFPYYKLRYGSSGVTGGFLYKTVPHITLKSIANNASIREGMAAASIKEAVDTGAAPEDLYDSPLEDRSIVRVAGPFTVESVPASVVVPIDDAGQPGPEQDCSGRSGETLRQSEWRDELLKAGIRGKGGQVLRFSRVEPLAGATYLHAEAEVSSRDSTSAFAGQRAAVCFGPEHAPMEQRLVELAWEEARSIKPRPGILLFVAFSFDPEAAKDIDELDPGKAGMKFMRVEMNDDLATQDLKKKRSTSESFWLIGQPDISVRCLTKGEDKGKVEVEVHGFDYFDLKKGQVVSGGAERIAVWLLDTDYDGRSLYPRQVFFPMAGEKKGWSKLAKSLQAEIDVEKIAAFRGSHSLPFEPGKWRRIAVKLVDDRGIESLVIRNLDEVLKG
jgi:adenine-specific DNA-methyltransferase